MFPDTSIERNTADDHESCAVRSRLGLRRGLAGRELGSMRVLAAVASLLAATDFASAADLSPPPLASAAYNWTGYYIGVNAGYAAATVADSIVGGGGSNSTRLPGFIEGAQLGANYQIGAIVFGFETDFDGSSSTKSIAVGALSGTEQIPWLGTLRGRVGFAFDRFLIYATAGGAGGELKSAFNSAAFGSTSTDQTFGAWTAGGGLEFGITNNLSARVEYLYVDSASVNVASVGPVTVTGHVQNNLVRAGLNLRLPVTP